jgi:hypothetical protein
MRTALGISPVRAAVGTVIEHALEQARPAHARWRAMRMRVIGGVLGCLLRWTGNDRRAQLGVGREHAMEANQMQPWTRDQCG